jgi:hypothetical protein
MGNVFAKDKVPSNVSGGANPPTPVLPKVTPPGPPPSPIGSLNRPNSMQNSRLNSMQNARPNSMQNARPNSMQNARPNSMQNSSAAPSPTVTQGGAGRRRKSRKSRLRKLKSRTRK